MPSFSYLSEEDMNDLVAYIQSLGNKRTVTAFVTPPDEYLPTTPQGRALAAGKTVDTTSDAAANAGRGIYTQNCAACHGLEGRGFHLFHDSRGNLWIAPLCLSLLAVLLLESRSALVTVAASCSLFLILRRRFFILALGAAAAGVATLIWTAPTIDALLSVGFGSSSDVSGNDMFSGRVDYLWLPLLSEWTSDIGLSLFGAGRYGIVTSKLWDTGTLIHADHAHNAIFNFFLDCGMILTGVLLSFLVVGTVAAWRVGRRLNSDLYWALFACIFGCGISMATQGDILPRLDNMYAFPIIAMMINLARLHYRMPVMVDPVLQNWSDVNSTTIQK